ncbi:MAG: radical SAM protein [Syntrophobacterales bacterium]|nr:radical SAM protein [Syntrophobacterales bacterium]
MANAIAYHAKNFVSGYRNMFLPYLRHLKSPGDFHPIVAYFYTDLNCNLSCDYCYANGRDISGMTMETAMEALAWLEGVGCRVLAYMGGEPLLRKDFIVELTRYAVGRGFFVYLPTNGILMDKAFIDAIGTAGVSAVNLAVDAVDGYPGIPKSLNRIRPQFEYLVKQEKKYNYITFLNINITRKNIPDVKELTEIARRYGIATDYHINEPPPIQYDTFKPEKGSWITEKEYEDIDKLVDWLIEKNLEGYTMVNSINHLRAMKSFIRHEPVQWECRAGILTMVIRIDGSFAPCFEFYGTDEDWGSIHRGHRFDVERLKYLKEKCSRSCLSTCNFQVYHYTRSVRHALQWVAKHAYGRFFGVS